MELIFIMVAVVLAETSFLFVKAASRTKFTTKKARRKIFVDTSTLIDGRILAVAQTGFLGDELLIPRSVIRELQLLADGKDGEKRSRARYGMDVANALERVVLADVEIFADDIGGRIKVDERLIELAKAHKGMIMTNDFNLAKVAATEKIEVLNINDLAMNMRSEFFPGEKFKLKINCAGNSPRQGVGHLPDGTMVVVDNASKHVGEEIDVEFIRILQTSAGKMMFAKIDLPRKKNNNKKRR